MGKWWLPQSFITLHYIYIISCTLLAFIIIYPYGNLRAIDAFFFGASANTESGLNTVDVKALKTYQQFVIYIFPIITNLGFVNILVVIVRIRWFENRLKQVGATRPVRRTSGNIIHPETNANTPNIQTSGSSSVQNLPLPSQEPRRDFLNVDPESNELGNTPNAQSASDDAAPSQSIPKSIEWSKDTQGPSREKALRIPSPRDRENGAPLEEVDIGSSDEDDDKISPAEGQSSGFYLRSLRRRKSGMTMVSLDRIATSIFVVGDNSSTSRAKSPTRNAVTNLPSLSSHVTVGSNSNFYNLTREDREKLGGIEYRSLKLLLKFVVGYFLGLHAFGVICLLPWIHRSSSKYRNYLEEQGQDKTWWAFYSSQTMISNLGFTLTADSMIHFNDATWPLLVMTFLAYAGNTCYPILLRVSIWLTHKLIPKTSSFKEPLRFLLDHPRRCYTLLFPGRVTWILFGILFVLNFLDVLFIIVLDLHNPTVTSLAPGPRVLAALFQAASSRHTGTATFNLANVNPAIQFSLLVMMYISVFPIAISIRASNTYEERALGKYSPETQPEDSQSPRSYLRNHLQNQLSFDLWYIFLGIFCITIAESSRVADVTQPTFTVFTIFFEVTSAYGNVGLSLGTANTLTSLCGDFNTFSKLVICAMMIRGRHRGLPYAIDRAIVLSGEELKVEERKEEMQPQYLNTRLKRHHTR